VTTAILLHGHYLGAWAWNEVRPTLEQAGWQVWSEALEGAETPWNGGGTHPAGDVTLSTHVAQVAAVVTSMPEPAVVLAHSYSGLVLQSVLGDPRCRSRVRAAVFLDAAVGRPGDTLLDVLDLAAPGATTHLAGARVPCGRWGLIAPPPAEAVGSTDPRVRALFNSNRTPAPWGTMVEALPATALHPERTPSLPCRYIRCADFPLLAPVATWLAECPGWEVEVWPSGHLPMLTEPERVVQSILIAGR
jgi:hypothetical protein